MGGNRKKQRGKRAGWGRRSEMRVGPRSRGLLRRGAAWEGATRGGRSLEKGGTSGRRRVPGLLKVW